MEATGLTMVDNVAGGVVSGDDIYLSGSDLTCKSHCSAGQYANCSYRVTGDGVDCWANW